MSVLGTRMENTSDFGHKNEKWRLRCTTTLRTWYYIVTDENHCHTKSIDLSKGKTNASNN